MLDKMDEYEIDPTRTVGATERRRDVGQTDGRTDGRSDKQTDGLMVGVKPTTSLCRGYNSNFVVYNNSFFHIEGHIQLEQYRAKGT